MWMVPTAKGAAWRREVPVTRRYGGIAIKSSLPIFIRDSDQFTAVVRYRGTVHFHRQYGFDGQASNLHKSVALTKVALDVARCPACRRRSGLVPPAYSVGEGTPIPVNIDSSDFTEALARRPMQLVRHIHLLLTTTALQEGYSGATPHLPKRQLFWSEPMHNTNGSSISQPLTRTSTCEPLVFCPGQSGAVTFADRSSSHSEMLAFFWNYAACLGPNGMFSPRRRPSVTVSVHPTVSKLSQKCLKIHPLAKAELPQGCWRSQSPPEEAPTRARRGYARWLSSVTSSHSLFHVSRTVRNPISAVPLTRTNPFVKLTVVSIPKRPSEAIIQLT